MNAQLVKSVSNILQGINTLGIHPSIEKGCCEVKTDNETQARSACQAINDAGMYARVLGFYPKSGCWLIGAARTQADAGE